ncbi:putative ribosomal protein S5/S7 [Helianthus annuus]|nr:putative ribosomal protein S5/S7 [Helianthus annuus]
MFIISIFSEIKYIINIILIELATYETYFACKCNLKDMMLFITCIGPREDATRIGSACVVRLSMAIYLLTTGACEYAFRNVKTVAERLANKLINAGKGSSNSYAIKE